VWQPRLRSPFAPRQKAREGFRYDWQRGVDIPLPLGEPVYAPMDGIIRIAGNHSAYSDMIVQIRHRETSPYLYSNHLHMLTVTVSADDLVTVGDLIGYSGESSSGFSHIHFEFRVAALGGILNHQRIGTQRQIIIKFPAAPAGITGFNQIVESRRKIGNLAIVIEQAIAISRPNETPKIQIAVGKISRDGTDGQIGLVGLFKAQIII
jgi:murein DD-endopeptidase MepM/ murein hydrolase activator NlpD